MYKNLLLCGIVVPLKVQNKTVGTLKFYYANYSDINQSQYAIAAGFGELLSAQLYFLEANKQASLRAKAEIKALQFQINPHFLFNTLNTIASFVRTDPNRARELLQDFSSFYRSTLENSEETIPLEKEFFYVEQYLVLEHARYGVKRIKVHEHIDSSVKKIQVPSFLLQPLVENAIAHGMDEERPLNIWISAWEDGDNVFLEVRDDGVGIPPDILKKLNDSQRDLGVLPSNQTSESHDEYKPKQHMGIAIANIRERITSMYPDSSMRFLSKTGEGTRITLRLAHLFKSNQ